MTIIDAPVSLLLGPDAHDGSVCLVPEHPARDNVCTVCKTLHMPSMLRVEYCACDVPDLFVRVGTPITGDGRFPTWQCQTCEKPNLQAIRHPLV